jgi:hypothetical protein
MNLDIATADGVQTASAITIVRESLDIIPDFVQILDCVSVISENCNWAKSYANF